MDEGPLVVVTDCDLPDHRIAVEVLTRAGMRVRQANCRTPEEVVAAARGAAALLVQWAPITADVLAELGTCRFISRLGIGYDMIDVAAATRRGIAVANTPEYCVEEVATHTIALALGLVRGIPALHESVSGNEWPAAGAVVRMSRPSDSTVSVIGFGRIGSRVAASARALGFSVLVHDPYLAAGIVETAGYRAVDLESALSQADIVSLHVPLTARTRHLIDRHRLELMKPGSVVVNTCRGGLIDESALVDALVDGRLGGAALDVFETEPLPADDRLRSAPRVLLTPHMAWYSEEALAELPRSAAAQIVEFLSGATVASIVNPGYEDHLREAGVGSPGERQ
ncbi:C-terminal binding protein [Nocardia brevicatena]|uniref:C-terminal binding protein n=1 Tax=Nocardia brevicatena TaxID=37327 RepID=UPI000593466E|nr:C-terminal binding protein [Nocardia brevicatena]